MKSASAGWSACMRAMSDHPRTWRATPSFGPGIRSRRLGIATASTRTAGRVLPRGSGCRPTRLRRPASSRLPGRIASAGDRRGTEPLRPRPLWWSTDPGPVYTRLGTTHRRQPASRTHSPRAAVSLRLIACGRARESFTPSSVNATIHLYRRHDTFALSTLAL